MQIRRSGLVHACALLGALIAASCGSTATPDVDASAGGAQASGGGGGAGASDSGGGGHGGGGSAVTTGGSGGAAGSTGGAGAAGGAAAQGGEPAMDAGGDGDGDGDGDGAGAGGAYNEDEPNTRDTGWAATCGGVLYGGHCVADVFEWCDYFTRSVQQRDCAALGKRCDASLQFGEEDTRGCVSGMCEAADEHCDGALLYRCHLGDILEVDCHRQLGPSSECELTEEGYGSCARSEPCDEPGATWCDAELHVTCDEDGKLVIEDCQGRTRFGRCIGEANNVRCNPSSTEDL